jgi:hypothetical protein
MSDFLQYILVWYNVWFTAPIAFVFLFAIFQLVMGGLDFGGETDVDADVDADIDVDADVDVDADMDVDADADTHSSLHGSSFVASALGILNVGKVPFTIILMSLFATWGISGLIVNEIVHINATPTRLGLNPQTTLGVTFVAALLCSILGTRYLALGLSKLFPESERAVTDYHLLGLRGRVISGRVTTTFGTARVQVPGGPELTVSCRVLEGEEIPLKGDTVVLINYDKERRIFDVTKADRSLAP